MNDEVTKEKLTLSERLKELSKELEMSPESITENLEKNYAVRMLKATARKEFVERIYKMEKEFQDIIDNGFAKMKDTKNLEEMIEWAKEFGEDGEIIHGLYNKENDTPYKVLEAFRNLVNLRVDSLKDRIAAIWKVGKQPFPSPVDKIVVAHPPMWL